MADLILAIEADKENSKLLSIVNFYFIAFSVILFYLLQINHLG